MNKITTTIIACLFMVNISAQKPSLTDSSYVNWGDIRDGKLSSMGKFVFYNTWYGLGGPHKSTICATNQEWQTTLLDGIFSEVFSTDEKYMFGVCRNRLIQIKLGTSEVDTLANTNDCRILRIAKQEYLLYQPENENSLSFKNLSTGKVEKVEAVQEYWIDKQGSVIVAKQINIKDSTETLVTYQPATGKLTKLFTGKMISNLIFGNTSKSIAFVSGNEQQKEIWYSTLDGTVARKLLTQTEDRNKAISTREFWQFSEDDAKVYLGIDEGIALYKVQASDPDIWSYQDRMMYTWFKGVNFKFPERDHMISVNVSDANVVSITQPGERVISNAVGKLKRVIIIQSIDSADRSLRSDQMAHKSYYIVSDDDRHRKTFLRSTTAIIGHWTISPDNKYIVYFNVSENVWKSYSIDADTTVSFAENMNKDRNIYEVNTRKQNYGSYGFVSWVKGSNKLILQGDKNIWLASVKGDEPARQLTKSPVNAIQTFYFTERPDGLIDSKTDYYLCSINIENKNTSLYRLNIGAGKLSKLFESDFFWAGPHEFVPPQFFQKASNAEAFLYLDMNVSRSPNYFFTRDFKKTVPQTNYYPERTYNWLTSELHTYRDSLGNVCQGILYKPENFDSAKKYPVIFTIYQNQNHVLRKYLSPYPVMASINIPLLVSNGYLVFKPDVYIKPGESGRYMVLSIVAAADHLSKNNWVDDSKIGLTGHSLGGGEVNYIITKTNRFAAAMAGAAIANMVNDYNDVWDYGVEKHIHSISMYGMSGPLEDAMPEYLDMSPTLHTKNIRTPLLLFHNDKDKSVNFYNSSQLFVQLRSTGKPVWLVSYEGEGHILFQKRNQLDYQKRIMGFFDYYLRNRPIPDWMQRHIQ
jgi:dienelactone hydrolase